MTITTQETHVIVGGGLAGASAAAALRRGGFDGRTVLAAGQPVATRLLADPDMALEELVEVPGAAA